MWLDLLDKLAQKSYFIYWLWSLLPSRCGVGGCEDNYLRWSENEILLLSGPYANRMFYACDDCTHRLRQISFRAGHETIHHTDGSIEYRPSETQETEPLEE